MKTINKLCNHVYNFVKTTSTTILLVWNYCKLHIINNNYFMFFTLSIFSLIIFEIIFVKEIYAVNFVYETIYDEMNDIPTEIIKPEGKMTHLKLPAGPNGNDIIKEEYPSNHVQGENDSASNKYGIETYLFIAFWLCGTALSLLNGK